LDIDGEECAILHCPHRCFASFTTTRQCRSLGPRSRARVRHEQIQFFDGPTSGPAQERSSLGRKLNDIQVALNRRDVLKLSALLVDVLAPWPVRPATRRKRVIVAGAGLAGLACGWELSKRGHEVIILEASNRVGGHVKTLHEGLADGLYADAGAEHFTKPGYELFHQYVKEFDLPVLPYPHRENVLELVDGRMIPESQARSASALRAEGYNQREIRYLTTHPDGDLLDLYFQPYMERIHDEY